MIDQFRFFDEFNNEISIGVGYQKDIYPIKQIRGDGGIIRDHLKGKTSGLKWVFNNQEIIKVRCYFGYPSVDFNYVIALYPIEDTEYLAPNNAVIYNADGSLHKVLTPPKLISKLAIERLGENNPPQSYAPDSLFFNHVNWDKDSKGDSVTSVWIGYHREWHENRVLNPATGEFGECIGSGRL